MNVLLLDNPGTNLSVWYSAQSHLQFIQNCGEAITVIVREKNIDALRQSWITAFTPDKIVTYKNYWNLIQKLRKQNDTKHFCLSWKEILLVRSMLAFKKRQLYFWFQGILPEEDFLRTKNKMRKALFMNLERMALKATDKLILVSHYMKEYIEKTRNLKLKDYVIIPCTSNLQYESKEKIKNSFLYIGGLTEWQRIDRILMMYKTVLEKIPASVFYLITYDTAKASELVDVYIPKEYHKNVITRTMTDRVKISNLLSSVEYGFLIRDDDPVNNVSSPIKLAEYLSCGVNVILSKAVTSYAGVVESNNCGIIIDNDTDIEKVFSRVPDGDASLKVYDEVFNSKVMIDRYKNFISDN